jgi:hypothetical protein
MHEAIAPRATALGTQSAIPLLHTQKRYFISIKSLKQQS